MIDSRRAFEEWVAGPPFELSTERIPDDPVSYAFPGTYKDINVDLAWHAWQEARKRETLLSPEEAPRVEEETWNLELFEFPLYGYCRVQDGKVHIIRRAAQSETVVSLPFGKLQFYNTKNAPLDWQGFDKRWVFLQKSADLEQFDVVPAEDFSEVGAK